MTICGPVSQGRSLTVTPQRPFSGSIQCGLSQLPARVAHHGEEDEKTDGDDGNSARGRQFGGGDVGIQVGAQTQGDHDGRGQIAIADDKAQPVP